MSEAVIGLIGVVLGAGLAIGWDIWRSWRQKLKARASVRAELDLNLQMIPPKRAMLTDAREQIRKGYLNPTITTHFSTVFHDLHIATIYPDLSETSAQSLHFIREHLRIVDDTMDALLDRLKADLQLKPADEVGKLYFGLVGDLIMVITRLEDMIQKHLAGQPVRIFDRTREYLKMKMEG